MLLRLAVSDASTPQKPDMSLTAETWREVYHLAVSHAVVAVAWDGVERMQAQAPEVLQSMPAGLTGKWFAEVQTIEAANSRMAAQAHSIRESLATGGFASQILKGASMAAYYLMPTHRQSADIDLWVLPAKGQYLSEHRATLIAFLRQQPDVSMGEIVYHHIETLINGTDVEFHVTPTWLCNPIHNCRLQTLFAQADSMTPQLQEIYAVLHAFRHIYHDGLALRHVLDYWLVSGANRATGIQEPTALYSQLGLLPFAAALNELGNNLFGQNDAVLSRRASHLLAALPARSLSRQVRWDYPAETLFVFPWRTWHFFWRKRLNKRKKFNI